MSLCVYRCCVCVSVCVSEEYVRVILAKALGGVWQAEGEESAGSLRTGKGGSLPGGGGHAEKVDGLRGRGPCVWPGGLGPLFWRPQ